MPALQKDLDPHNWENKRSIEPLVFLSRSCQRTIVLLAEALDFGVPRQSYGKEKLWQHPRY